MTKAMRLRDRKFDGIKRHLLFLRSPKASTRVFRLHELWSQTLASADIMSLQRYRAMDMYASVEADGEMRYRVGLFMTRIIRPDQVEDFLSLLRDNNAGFGGYEVLKTYVPASEEYEPPKKRIFSLFTPLGHFHVLRDYLICQGYRITHTNGGTLEQPRLSYGDTISDSITLRSEDNNVFIDVIESVNDVPFYPAFRMATTLHMHCLFADILIAPYANLSCEKKGIINPAHYIGKHLLTLRPEIQDVVDNLQKNAGLKMHRNPRKLWPHEGKCGIDPNCLHTLRTTVSPGTAIYRFRRTTLKNDKFLDFLSDEGVIWRLGGWSCYPDGMWGLDPVLSLSDALHTTFDGQEVIDALGDNQALSIALGWD